MYHLVTLFIKPDLKGRAALAIVVVMAGLGVGAFNEIVEFIITVILPDTGVGGYINTSLDLVADAIGAIGAMLYILVKENASHKARTV